MSNAISNGSRCSSNTLVNQERRFNGVTQVTCRFQSRRREKSVRHCLHSSIVRHRTLSPLAIEYADQYITNSKNHGGVGYYLTTRHRCARCATDALMGSTSALETSRFVFAPFSLNGSWPCSFSSRPAC